MGLFADLGIDPNAAQQHGASITPKPAETPDIDERDPEPQGFEPVTEPELLGDGMLANILPPEQAAELRTRTPESYYEILKEEFTQGAKAALGGGDADALAHLDGCSSATHPVASLVGRRTVGALR